MKKNRTTSFILSIIAILAIGALLWVFVFKDLGRTDDSDSSQEDERVVTSVDIVVEGLDHPWDVKTSDNGDIYFTQRDLGLYKFNGEVSELYIPDDLYSAGEGGMLGFDLAPDFNDSKELYVCFNSKTQERGLNVVVSKLTLSDDLSSVDNREDIIEDIESADSGRHSGCRVLFDRNDNNVIWVTTGDAANANLPQDPKSLNGKVLRVDRNGQGVEGNLEDPFDSRIFSYGHRNIQGITLFEEYDGKYGYGFTSEHGPRVDDEINPLIKGNYGWDPLLPYFENVPMTDKNEFPEAIEAVWSSGNRTIAMCGIEYIDSGPFEGDVLLAALKDSFILRFDIEGDQGLNRLEEVIMGYGRIRQVYETPEGKILFTTDNGRDDVIGEIVFN
jgi:glucose/arabinose dehydrogenase